MARRRHREAHQAGVGQPGGGGRTLPGERAHQRRLQGIIQGDGAGAGAHSIARAGLADAGQSEAGGSRQAEHGV